MVRTEKKCPRSDLRRPGQRSGNAEIKHHVQQEGNEQEDLKRQRMKAENSKKNQVNDSAKGTKIRAGPELRHPGKPMGQRVFAIFKEVHYIVTSEEFRNAVARQADEQDER
jgi:hypothetical protein